MCSADLDVALTFACIVAPFGIHATVFRLFIRPRPVNSNFIGGIASAHQTIFTRSEGERHTRVCVGTNTIKRSRFRLVRLVFDRFRRLVLLPFAPDRTSTNKSQTQTQGGIGETHQGRNHVARREGASYHWNTYVVPCHAINRHSCVLNTDMLPSFCSR